MAESKKGPAEGAGPDSKDAQQADAKAEAAKADEAKAKAEATAEAPYVDVRSRHVQLRDLQANIRAHEARVRGAAEACLQGQHAGNLEAMQNNARAANNLVARYQEDLNDQLVDAIQDVPPSAEELHRIYGVCRELLEACVDLAMTAQTIADTGVDTTLPNRVNVSEPIRKRAAVVRVFWAGNLNDQLKITDECTIKANRLSRIGLDEFRRLRNQMRHCVEVPAIANGTGAAFYLVTRNEVTI